MWIITIIIMPFLRYFEKINNFLSKKIKPNKFSAFFVIPLAHELNEFILSILLIRANSFNSLDSCTI